MSRAGTPSASTAMPHPISVARDSSCRRIVRTRCGCRDSGPRCAAGRWRRRCLAAAPAAAGRRGFPACRVAASARVASSMVRSRRTRISAPRRVSTYCRRGRIDRPAADVGDRRPRAAGACLHAGQRPQLDALVRMSHDLLPGHRRQRAAGHAVGRLIVVVAEPDAGDVVAGEADEPGVAIGVGGAGLAGDRDARQAWRAGRCLAPPPSSASSLMSCATCGLITCTGFLPSRSKRQIRSPAPVRTSRMRVRRDRLAAVDEDAVAAGVVEHRHLVGADRHRRRVDQRRAQPGLAGDVADLGAAGLRDCRCRARSTASPGSTLIERTSAWSASSSRNSRRNSSSGTSCRCRPASRPPPRSA